MGQGWPVAKLKQIKRVAFVALCSLGDSGARVFCEMSIVRHQLLCVCVCMYACVAIVVLPGFLL